MNMRFLSSLAIASTCFISTSANALLLSFADSSGGVVPGTTTNYTISSTSDEAVNIGAGATGDGDHTWNSGGQWLRKRGGNWSASITFDSPVPANKLTFSFIDIDTVIPGQINPTVTFSLTGTADTQDFFIDPGFVTAAGAQEFSYDNSTGILSALTTPPNDVGYHSQLFGNSLDEVMSMSLVTSNVSGGDYTGVYFGFVVPSTPPPIGAVPVPAAVWLFGSVIAGFAGFRRFKSKS